MSYVIGKIYEQYSQLWEMRDKRLSHLPFMGHPASMVLLVAGYLYIIRNGKHFMETVKPYSIERIIVVYNIFQIIANAVIFLLVTHFVFIRDSGFSFICQSVDYSTTDLGLFQAYLSYAYFILKLLDYFDTIFFILRKKSGHVSFLHVYHHVAISICAYICVLFATAGQGIMLGYLNSFVHAIMYTYYLLSIWMPSVKTSKLIKRNITKLQMVQFGYLLIHFSHGFFISSNECNYPKFVSFIGASQNLFMIILFADFYKKAYGKRDKIADKKND